ncbi:MAG: hypothetical protein Q9217_001107 [Psora testacea]
MVQYIPPPDPRNLLPPLLACLPTAFASPRPPPALLPLLTPILRQRVQLLAATTPSPSESWLPLLCWKSELAQRLIDTVTESDAFELHPISGEIEFGPIEPLKYRRLDDETLQARIAASEMRLTILVLWCEGDQEGQGNGWRVAEVRPLDDEENISSGQWCSSMTEAEEQARRKDFEEAVQERDEPTAATNGGGSSTAKDDDDDYWNQYDNTPGRSPEADRSPDLILNANQNKHAKITSEAEYFARYAQVHPEMDNEEQSEVRAAIGESTLNDEAINSTTETAPQYESRDPISTDRSSEENHTKTNITTTTDPNLNHPTAIPPSSGQATVSHLEALASSEAPTFPTERAVRQHISTSIKSLFRLCKDSGIERADFEQIVKTEMEMLGMVEDGND